MSKKTQQKPKVKTYDQKAKEIMEKTLEALPEFLLPKASAGRFLNKPKNPNRFKNKKK
jgi:hypothetical protein